MNMPYQNRGKQIRFRLQTSNWRTAIGHIFVIACVPIHFGCGLKASDPAISQRMPAADTRPSQSSGGYKLGQPYTINGRTYVPRHDPDYNRVGLASWYGQGWHGRQTANGETYDENVLSGAHPTLPLPSYVRVTNLENGIIRVVRINDRGPFVPGRIIDLSLRAARELNFIAQGLVKVRVEYIGPAPL